MVDERKWDYWHEGMSRGKTVEAFVAQEEQRLAAAGDRHGERYKMFQELKTDIEHIEGIKEVEGGKGGGRSRVAELEAQIAEMERSLRKSKAETEAERQELDILNQNVQLRHTLQTLGESYSAHVKRLELILSAKVDSLQKSNEVLSASMASEVSKTQSAARNMIVALNDEIQKSIHRSMVEFKDASDQIRTQFERLVERRNTIDIVVICVAVVSILIATNAVVGIPV